MTSVFNTVRHLLPDGIAWRIVVEKTLKKYVRGLSTIGGNAVDFVDDVFDDLWPSSTRELAEWQYQFNADAWGTVPQQRDYLEALWSETRSTSPAALQNKLHLAGFTDAYVYDSFTSVLGGSAVNGVSHNFTALGTSYGFAWSNDGNILFFTDITTGRVHGYVCTQALDITTAIPYGILVMSAVDTAPRGIFITPGGGSFFVTGLANNNIYKFTMPGYGVAAAVLSQTKSTSPYTGVTTIHFNETGTRMWCCADGQNQIVQWDLSTPWDLSSAGAPTARPISSSPQGFGWKNGKFYVMDLALNRIDEYATTANYDIAGSAATGGSIPITTTTSDRSFQFGPHVMWVLDGDTLHEYSYAPSARNPQDYTNQPLFGTTQCGDNGSISGVPAFCGEKPPLQNTDDSAVCNTFLANEVYYLVNVDLTDSAPPPVPDDSDTWMNFWYVGGTPFGTTFDLAPADRQRFEGLVLRIGPAEKWIVTIVNYT